MRKLSEMHFYIDKMLEPDELVIFFFQCVVNGGFDIG